MSPPATAHQDWWASKLVEQGDKDKALKKKEISAALSEAKKEVAAAKVRLGAGRGARGCERLQQEWCVAA